MTVFPMCATLLQIFRFFYIRDSVQSNSRLKKSNEMLQYTDIYLLLNYYTCFGRPPRPSSGIHKTVVAASGTEHSIWERASSNVTKKGLFWEGRSHTSPYLVTFEEARSHIV